MRVSMATESAPGHLNEDFAAATANTTVLLDGAGLSGVDDGGCLHGVAWYVRRLGGEILAGLVDQPASELGAVLADAIGAVADSHKATCDIGHPATPSSTVVIVNAWEGTLRYLVLADSVLVLHGSDQQIVISDDREATVGRRYRTTMDRVEGGTRAHDEARRAYVQTLLSYRNRPGGFWVAAADPDAACHALTGAVETANLKCALLLSDGASRIVDRFGLSTWDHVVELVASSGGEALLSAVRAAERADPHCERWPRGKVYDDATVVLCDRV
jgi:hypothetical protein